MAMNFCVFEDGNGDKWYFHKTINAQGTHYTCTDGRGNPVAETLNMTISFQSWCQDLIKQAMDSSHE